MQLADMNESEQVGKIIVLTRTLETLLEEQFGAEGKGLHEKLNSVESSIPEHLLKRGHFIASIRNKAVHQEAHAIPDGFYETCEKMIAEIRALPANHQASMEAEAEAEEPATAPSPASVKKRAAAGKQKSGSKKKTWIALAAVAAALALLSRR